MDTIAQRCMKLWDTVSHTPAQVPTELQIPADHVDEGKAGVFKKDEHYFEVRVNEMFLSDKRKWFVNYLPMVLVISEFYYGRSKEVVPFVVGPNLIEKDGVKVPTTGMLFRDLRVAGLHPYIGGQMTLSLILYRLPRDNYLTKLLQVIEAAGGILDFATMLGSYLKVASVVLDGLEALSSSFKVEPVVGLRWDFDPSNPGTIDSGYFALINRPEGSLEKDKLSVQNGQLLYGGNPRPPSRPADADYILYSVLPKPERNDFEALPFQQVWDRVLADASIAKKDNWNSAKANMASLYQTMIASPDLTWKQKQELPDWYIKRMEATHKKAVEIGMMSGSETPQGDMDKARLKSLSVLDL